MTFNDHSRLKGQHAFLSASKYYWINYDVEKLEDSYNGFLAVQRGTELHDLAYRLIKNNVRLPKSKKTLNMYVNDAIGFQMIPEQILFYSENCFGTCDAIIFKNNFLRIHDLKTGVTPVHIEQLMIYDALFCLEYGADPGKIEHELRIYQNDDVLIATPEPDEIYTIMDKIVEFDKCISDMKAGII